MLFLELKAKAHSDIDIIVELLETTDNCETYETGGDYSKTKYKLKCKNRGSTLYSAPNKQNETFNIRNNSDFELRISEALYNKINMYHYPEGEIILIRFVTKDVENHYWKIEKAEALPQSINQDINEDYEKEKMANSIQRRNSVSTTDDRIAWAVAINNATKLVSEINVEIDEKIKLIEDNTARIYELVKSLDTYLTNQTEEIKDENRKPVHTNENTQGEDDLPF